MGRRSPGYPPSHRDHHQPQPEVCELCGHYTHGADLEEQQIEGLRGRHICRTFHSQWMGRPTRRDVEIMTPGVPGPKFIGQGRIYEPGAPVWWFSSPLGQIESYLSAGDLFLLADDLAPGDPSTWTDRKSSLVLDVNGSPTVATATDLGQGEKRALTFTSSTSDYLTTSTFSSDPSANGATLVAVVKPENTNTQTIVSQQDGAGTGRTWLRTDTAPRWIGQLPGPINGPIASLGWEIVSLRTPSAASTSLADLRVDNLTSNQGSSNVASADGQLVVGGIKTPLADFDGSLAALIIALSDLTRQDTAAIVASLQTYYGM